MHCSWPSWQSCTLHAPLSTPCRKNKMATLLALLASTTTAAATVQWTDAKTLNLRGSGFDSSELSNWADRLPGAAEGVVRDAIWTLSRDSAGMYIDFVTDSRTLQLNCTYVYDTFTMWHFASTGVAGFDLYQWDEGNSTWRWSGTTHNNVKKNEVQAIGTEASGQRTMRLHFPLYNGVADLYIGHEEGTTLTSAPVQYSGAPIVWYGTSIAQGGVVSRPGFAFTNNIMRNIEREVMNFGFSGNCLMEEDVVKYIVTIKPTPELFVLDCEWNMEPELIQNRTIPMMKYIREHLPTTKIVLAEATPAGNAWANTVANATQNAKWAILKTAFATLKESMLDIYYVNGPSLYNIAGDTEHIINPTVGGTHPTDLGQKAVTDFYSTFLKTILDPVDTTTTTTSYRSALTPGLAGNSALHEKTVRDGFALERAMGLDVSGGLKYYNVETLGLSVMGRAFNGTNRYYNRFPAAAKETVRGIVWTESEENTGMGVHFLTNSSQISLNYSLVNAPDPLWHMPASGTSGVDLYRYDATLNKWRNVHCATAYPAAGKSVVVSLASNMVDVQSNTHYVVYLPLRNEAANISIGVEEGAYLTKDDIYHPDGVTTGTKKPIVWYGTSIDAGGVASRPGTTYTNILSRNLDRQVLNFGFPGNGRMETSVAEYLVQLDPILYVIDCLPNLDAQSVTNNTVPLIKYIRAHRPTTKILLVAGTTYGNHWLIPESNDAKRAALKAQFDILSPTDPNLFLFLNSNNELFASDWLVNPTVGGTHPSDLGHREIADYYTTYLQQFLK